MNQASACVIFLLAYSVQSELAEWKAYTASPSPYQTYGKFGKTSHQRQAQICYSALAHARNNLQGEGVECIAENMKILTKT
ncbi:hypothetical protein GGR57DRAFT_500050 [Xylariaceae sp. FL1272]|nr:hypothetical protein GGR57DRAFT_500050 [Xylariaceae sp. FL1272]